MATFNVINEAVVGQTPMEKITFTSGLVKKDDITRKEILRRYHFVFDVGAHAERIPLPKFKINDLNFRPDETSFSVKTNDSEE